MISKKLVIFTAISISFLSGCARMLTPQGDDKYDCNRKENPDSPYCHSFKAIDKASQGKLPPTRYDEVTDMSQVDRNTGVSPVSQSGSTRSPDNSAPVFYSSIHESNGTSQKPPRDGTPIREVAPIQRVWVKKHQDNSNRLIGTTVVYAELGSNRWAGFPDRPRSYSAKSSGQAIPHLPSDQTIQRPTAQAAEGRVNQFSQPTNRGASNLEMGPASNQEANSELPN